MKKDDQSHVNEHAETLESLMPAVMRSLFTLDPTHPAAELPVAQLRICNILLGGMASMSSLSKELRISVSAMTQMADRLEATGLVERCADPTDRRSRCLRLTAYGTELMASRRAVRRQQASEALSRLSSDKREALISLLRDLLESGRSAYIAHYDDGGGRLEV